MLSERAGDFVRNLLSGLCFLDASLLLSVNHASVGPSQISSWRRHKRQGSRSFHLQGLLSAHSEHTCSFKVSIRTSGTHAPRRRPRPRSATALCPPGDSGASSAHLTGPHSRSGCAGPAPLPSGGPSFPGPRVPRAHALSEAWLRVLCAHRGSALSPGEGGVRLRGQSLHSVNLGLQGLCGGNPCGTSSVSAPFTLCHWLEVRPHLLFE